jgi:RHS repeat-associated protein
MNFTRKDNGLNQYRMWSPYSIINYDDDFGNGWGSPGAANGVLMQDGWVTASYNALNQPIAVWSPAYSGTPNYMWFGYDPLGRCVKRWVGPYRPESYPDYGANPATYLYYDGWNLIQEGPQSSIADRVYVHGPRTDEVVAQITPANNWIRYFHYDAMGHCTLQTDGGGGIVEQYDYDAFGFPYFYDAGGNATGYYDSQGRWIGYSPWGNRFLFTGREWLSDLKLYDYRNRLYQPELGRFMQPDPKEFAAGDYNLYRYCHNDPVNHADPTGLETLTRPEIDEQVGNTIVGLSQFVGDHAHGVLDAVGTLDPTPITDLANAGLYAAEGDRANAAISVVAAVPYIGDVAKLGKYEAKALRALEGGGKTARKVNPDRVAAAQGRISALQQKLSQASTKAEKREIKRQLKHERLKMDKSEEHARKKQGN